MDTAYVRPFEGLHDYAAMVDYFLGGGDAFLVDMGIDPARVPTRERWLATALADHARPDAEKGRFFLAWLHEGRAVGHSCISHIAFGDSAHVHMHLWNPSLRRAGVGTDRLTRSLDLYFERFELEQIVCEPFAENPGPNRTARRLGFRHEKRYRTVPTEIALELDVHRYTLEREDWMRLRAGKRAE